ncbi:MAG: hypothetical protein JJU06_05940 [Ectothiorhodospiraceae bacterium]|nr:hypothetical protein [Ectothiorhodospiraceae bacterium]
MSKKTFTKGARGALITGQNRSTQMAHAEELAAQMGLYAVVEYSEISNDGSPLGRTLMKNPKTVIAENTPLNPDAATRIKELITAKYLSNGDDRLFPAPRFIFCTGTGEPLPLRYFGGSGIRRRTPRRLMVIDLSAESEAAK